MTPDPNNNKIRNNVVDLTENKDDTDPPVGVAVATSNNNSVGTCKTPARVAAAKRPKPTTRSQTSSLLRFRVKVVIPNGPLGIQIECDKVTGRCVVTGVAGGKNKNENSKNFQVGDILDTLNNTKLAGKGLEYCTRRLRETATTRRYIGILRQFSGSSPPSKTKETKTKSKKTAPAVSSPRKTTATPIRLSKVKNNEKKVPPSLVSSLPKTESNKNSPVVVSKNTSTKPTQSMKAIPSIGKKKVTVEVKENEKKAPPFSILSVTKTEESNSKYIQLPDVPLLEYPKPGTIDDNKAFYVTLNNESYTVVAAKLGLDSWRDLALVQENVDRYGELKANTTFKKDTLLRIPTDKCSQWKLAKLINRELQEINELAICGCCQVREKENDPDPMLICDGCDHPCHLSCAGLSEVPERDWLCQTCQDVLKARKEYYHSSTNKNKLTMEAELPPLPELPMAIQSLAVQAQAKLYAYLTWRKEAAVLKLQENQRIVAQRCTKRIAQLKDVVIPQKKTVLATAKSNFEQSERQLKIQHGIRRWKLRSNGRPDEIVAHSRRDNKWYRYNRPDFWMNGYGHSAQWNHAVQRFNIFYEALKRIRQPLDQVEQELQQAEQELVDCENEDRTRDRTDKKELQELLLQFAILMNTPILKRRSNIRTEILHRPLWVFVCWKTNMTYKH